MKPYPKRKKLAGVFLVTLIPLTAIILSYVLVYKKPLDEWNSLENVVMGADTKSEEIISVFKDKLEPILSEPEKLEIDSVGIGLNLVPVAKKEKSF